MIDVQKIVLPVDKIAGNCYLYIDNTLNIQLKSFFPALQLWATVS